MSLTNPIIVAVDGPAASGKGTLARKIAKYFDLEYLDTGCIYRSLGLHVLQNNIDFADHNKITSMAAEISLEDLSSNEIHNEEVGRAASIVSAIPEVRRVLLEFQRNIAKSPNGAVLDGRDIGTIICPQADFKFFITADIKTRAQRRYKQLQNKDNSIIYHDVLTDLTRRDERDLARSVAPLARASDAVNIDTTDMDASSVWDSVLSIMLEKINSHKD